MPGISRIKVTFLPHNRVIEADAESNLLELADKALIDLRNSCNAAGTCGKCKIQLLDGQLTPITKEERELLSSAEIDRGIRLACRTEVLSDASIRVIRTVDSSSLRIVEDGITAELGAVAPAIKKKFVELNEPSLEDNLADVERLEIKSGLKINEAGRLAILKNLPAVLREKGFKITAVAERDRIIGVEAGDTVDKAYGLAVDIGTTTIVAGLIDLVAGREIATASAANPQARYGQDVLSRIQFAQDPEKLKKLQRLIVNKLNQLIRAVCRQAGVSRVYIYEVAAAGNATMLHLLLGVDPTALSVSPYIAGFRRGLSVGAGELGLDIADFGRLYALPSVSAYVGADIVAGIIAARLQESREPALLVDIGTNGEIVFGSSEGLVACSCAAGPALEGMNISCGTIAVDGAIELIDINGSVEVRTINNRPPIGLCGSGVVDAIAELRRHGIIGDSGRLLSAEEFSEAGGDRSLVGRFQENGEARFMLTEAQETGARHSEGIFISQKDVRQVQLAKGAIASGIRVLLREVGVEPGGVAKVFVAGAFGKHLRLESLVSIGLIPEELADKVVFVGNTSKTGAALCLLSADKRAEAEAVAAQTRYFELSVYPGYDELFINSLRFPNLERGVNC